MLLFSENESELLIKEEYLNNIIEIKIIFGLN